MSRRRSRSARSGLGGTGGVPEGREAVIIPRTTGLSSTGGRTVIPYYLDLLGVFVFAISGALAAGRKSLDLLGV
ncbi:MAG: hypothetical protein AVDCRST_MAG89-4903, partial [uncultured Gemmatimonadetes bacterium]